jgi:membrane protein DedA with SNARE-associated domain
MANAKISALISTIGFGIVALFIDNQIFTPIGEFKNSLLMQIGILALICAGIAIAVWIAWNRKN